MDAEAADRAGLGRAFRSMPRGWLAVAGVILAGLLLQTAVATELRRLDGPRGLIEVPVPGQATLVVIFEDACRYCLDMLTTAETVAPRHSLRLVAVGVGPNAAALRRWADRARLSAPITHASTRFIASVGGVEVTPITLLFDADGRQLLRLRGKRDAEALSAALAAYDPAATNAAPQSATPAAHPWLTGDALARTEQLAEHLRGNDVVMFEVDYRHRRLGEALREQNLAFARYQLDKMQSAMRYGGIRRPQRQESHQRFFELYLEPFRVALQDGAKDGAPLDQSFRQFTAGCQACHVWEGVEFVPVTQVDPNRE